MRFLAVVGWAALVSWVGEAQGQSIGAVSVGPVAGLQVRGPEREAVVGGAGSFGLVSGRWFLGPEFLALWGGRTRVRAVALVARFSGTGNRVRPFLVGGAGSYDWRNRYQYFLPDGQGVDDWAGIQYFSGSFGGGAELGVGGRLNSAVELRYHGNIQRSDVAEHRGRGVVTAAVSLRYRW